MAAVGVAVSATPRLKQAGEIGPCRHAREFTFPHRDRHRSAVVGGVDFFVASSIAFHSGGVCPSR